jgi:hypothetical protein
VRETAALAETLTGVSLSSAAVSRLARPLDAQVAAFHRRPIALPVRYLLLDGLWVAVRESARTRRRVVPAAYGIAADGRRELLDYRQTMVESTAAWGRLLGFSRGRTGCTGGPDAPPASRDSVEQRLCRVVSDRHGCGYVRPSDLRLFASNRDMSAVG